VDAPYPRHQGRSRSRLLRALDNKGDGVSSAFPWGKQNGIFSKFYISFVEEIRKYIKTYIKADKLNIYNIFPVLFTII